MSVTTIIVVLSWILSLVDWVAYLSSGEQRFKKARYLLPWIGGHLALWDATRPSPPPPRPESGA